ncbi:YiiG family protein [Pseudomonas sp. BIGb0164]|uniref:YiiG family protein n=1 Tax=Pseudomonas sp. BIGb0164 TaxID=2940605 RepID=UPI002169AA9E|nr:YiiG family protein [Pseudomonas sp. BIGb0164]MCS4246066.1 hypothetical protein [Pseudomonas sp. BIGb0164]
MNPKWLLPIGLILGLALLGLAGATKPLQRIQFWLDQRDSPHTAAASALAPIIDCANRIDRDTRLAFYRMRSTEPEAPDHDQFGDSSEPEPRVIQAAVCSQLYTLKLERQQPGSQLVGLASVYAYRLHRFTSVADRVTPTQAERLSLSGRQAVVLPVTESLRQELVQEGDDYLRVSTQLRQQLEEQDLNIRPAQLALLESRFGRDLHWHVLNYMIIARHAVNALEQGMHDARLTPQAVASQAAALQQAADAGKAYLRTHPTEHLDEEARHLWYTITPAADAYLAALGTLHQDWLHHAAPQQLSDDYYLVTRRYDALLSYYNRPARNAF